MHFLIPPVNSTIFVCKKTFLIYEWKCIFNRSALPNFMCKITRRKKSTNIRHKKNTPQKPIFDHRRCDIFKNLESCFHTLYWRTQPVGLFTESFYHRTIRSVFQSSSIIIDRCMIHVIFLIRFGPIRQIASCRYDPDCIASVRTSYRSCRNACAASRIQGLFQ